MQTLVIRIEASTPDQGYPVRGVRFNADDEQISDEFLGALPCPLPPVHVGGREIGAALAVSDVMLVQGDSELTAVGAGRYLWNLLAETRTMGWWQSEADAGNGAPLRTMLDVRAPDLRFLPWELMTRSPDGHRPFRSHRNSWSRGEGLTPQTPDLLVPVRMLVVVGDPNDRNLRVDDEVDAIMGALHSMTGRWHVEVLVKPTLHELNRRLDRLSPNVLHVISHGRVGDEGSVLTFPVDDNNAWELNVSDVADLAGPPPRLVVLNACRSKDGQSLGRDGLGATWTFTDAFLTRGALAVIAMQGNIPSNAAIPFSQELYRSLADGDAVDVACAKGRQVIFEVTRTGADDRSWAMPSLHLRGMSDRVLHVAVPVAGNPLQDPPYCTAFRKVAGYVDRAAERWQLLTCLDPAGAGPERPLYLVEGPPKVGKSAIVASALLSYHLRGRRVVYLDVDGVKRTSEKSPGDSWGRTEPDQFGAGWIDVLRHIRDELRYWLPGADPYVQRFDDRLARYKTAGVNPPLPDYDPEQARPDLVGECFDEERENYQQVIAAVFGEFCRMLADIAGREPLLLALDHLHAMVPYDLQTYVVPFLLDPLGRDDMANVHAVLIDRPDQLKKLRAESRLRFPAPMQVKKFRHTEIRRLGGDYCAHLQWLPIDPRVQALLTAFSGLGDEFDCILLEIILGAIANANKAS